MLISFSHKGLKEVFETGKTKFLPQERIPKIKHLLSVLNSAVEISDLRLPGLRLHKLKAPPFRGFWSIDVSGNYRIVFEISSGNAKKVNYFDTH